MHTLFPVQCSDHATDNQPDIEAIQGALINTLVECCLIEQWVNERFIEVTTTTDYLANDLINHGLPQVLESLPNQYQAFFAQDHLLQDRPLIVIQTGDDKRLLLPVELAYATPWRLHKACLPLLHSLNNGHGSNVLLLEPLSSAPQLLDILLSMMDHSTLVEAGILKLKESLEASFVANQLSAAANITTSVYSRPHWYQTLIAAEQWASLMDRPFHPLAKGKLGFTESAYQRYMAEFNQPVDLVWVAIAKSHVMVAHNVKNTTTQNPVAYLLDKAQQQQIMQELQDKNLTDTHIAIPVHPWQMTHVIDDMYADDIANGTVVALQFSGLTTYASSSMRSMLLNDDTANSIKLPLGVYALNSKRYLPALKLVNGEKNQAILMEARQQDTVLATQLRLWDERLWWGYMLPSHVHDKSSINPYFYQEKPTHLGAMLRQLPLDLCDDTVRLLPMASLGMLVYKQGVSHHVFDGIIQAIPQSNKMPIKVVAINCFKNLCDVFLGTMLRCLRLGFAPEMHGQNILIVLKDHRFTSLLLRDHDSVRIYLPWLTRHNIADPEYLSPPDFKNRLYRETPQALIFYLQSLGLLVNIRAIIEALVEHYHIDENVLWQEVMSSIETALATIDFDADQFKVIRDELLSSQHYPHKTLLLPVIERGSDPHGSMPAGESFTTNPFNHVKKSGQLSAKTAKNDRT